MQVSTVLPTILGIVIAGVFSLISSSTRAETPATVLHVQPVNSAVQTKMPVPAPNAKSASKAVAPAKPAAKTYSDPFAYCAAVKNADKPAKPYTGPTMPWSIAKALAPNKEALAMILKTEGYATWRCMHKQVYACVVGANIPCYAKADTHKKPHEGIINYCKAEKNTDFIPAAATGRTTIYAWSCKAGKPVRRKPVTLVDARGYPADFWEKVIKK